MFESKKKIKYLLPIKTHREEKRLGNIESKKNTKN
jgi:hypothetical protein